MSMNPIGQILELESARVLLASVSPAAPAPMIRARWGSSILFLSWLFSGIRDSGPDEHEGRQWLSCVDLATKDRLNLA